MKMLSVKKICAVFLSAALLTSTISGLTVSAAEETPLILGDANLDGAVSVADATEIQKYLAESADFGIRQEVSANVDNTEININSVTQIQKYLSGYTTESSIGQPVDEGEDGIIVEKTTKLYMPAVMEGILEENQQVYYSTKYNDIPFIEVNNCLSFFRDFLEKSDFNIEASDNGNIVICTIGNDLTAEFNYSEKYIEFSDYDLFITKKDGLPMDLIENNESKSTADEPVMFLRSPYDHYYNGDPIRISLEDYSIPMLKENGRLFIPLSTFNDIFISQTEYVLVSIDEHLFFFNQGIILDTSNEITQLYYSIEPKETLSEEMTKFNYNELCLNLDLRYGLKDTHKIKDFDSYLNRMGLKKEYLSGNVYRIDKANIQLSTACFADFHSTYVCSSPYFDRGKYSITDEPTANSKTYMDRYKRFADKTAIRSSILGEVEPYERRGDTVFITFDGFIAKSKSDYYNENKEPDLTDTIELFSYSLEKLKNEDSDVKNVVIDLSCNTGGNSIACAYAIYAVLGSSNISLLNPITNALHQNVVECDLNLDGKIDENDKSMKALGKNIALITSDISFSCGNLFPCNIKYNDANVLALGQQSGGGACVIGYVATATGSLMQISSNNQLVSVKNGSLMDIDHGLMPDIYLTANRMYDRDYVCNLVSEQFGN